MALDTERVSSALSSTVKPAIAGLVCTLRQVWAPAAAVLKPWLTRAGAVVRLAGKLLAPVWAWVIGQPLVRMTFGSLRRRIIVANLFGFVVLLLGILYLSETQSWLIEAKRESLKAQSEIIAAAIAASASVDSQELVIDPDKLPEIEGSLKPFRDDAFSSLELSIKPERVNPILRRLVQPTTTRARIYTRDGTLIADTRTMHLQRGGRPTDEPDATLGKVRTKDFWTRLRYWLIDKELPVYKEIGNANGTLYPEVRDTLNGGKTTAMLLLNQRGEQIVSVAAPIQRARAVLGVLLLSSRPGDIEEIRSEERQVIWTLALMALVASLAASLLLARTVAGPMRRLSAAAEVVSRNISARQELPDYSDRSDEVGQMAKAFRAMTASLYRRIEASEKFAADVAHELKNPLTAARSTAEALVYAKTDEQRAELVEQIQIELKRLNRLISDVSNASRLDAELARQQLERVVVTDILSGVESIFRDKAEKWGCRLTMDIAASSLTDPYVIRGNEGRLAQVFTNLVDNAISFAPKGSVVRILARRLEGLVEVAVEDEGPGIDEDKLTKVFERFYTYRPTAESSRGNNSGLGLSISGEIIRAHRGEIFAENRYAPGVAKGGKRLGARFVVRLPAPVPAGGGRLGVRRT
jgi:two-component system sensor histidine kinase ChvG